MQGCDIFGLGKEEIMTEKRLYNGLDIVKLGLALLVAARHMIQIFYPPESKWRLLIGGCLSNLAVPVFFIIAGFFLFQKVDREQPESSRKAVFRYCGRILKLYILWSVLYLPLDYHNWYYNPDRNVGKAVFNYIQCFFFGSTTVQLWYLPAVLVACLLVWFCYQKGAKIGHLLVAGWILFTIGCMCDNWYYNHRFPEKLMELLLLYFRYFLTVRNGLFYGFFFVSLGLWFAKTKKQIPLGVGAGGFAVFVLFMFLEVRHCENVNLVFSAAPASFFLFAAAIAIPLKNRKLYPRLRGMSDWIYLSQTWFFQIYGWTAGWNPLPSTKKGITLSIMVPMVLFAWGMTMLSEKKTFRWLKKMI